MTWNWQDIAALGVVGIALGYLLQMAWRRTRASKAGSCATGACGSCPIAAASPLSAKNGQPLPTGPIVSITGPFPRSRA